MSKYTKLLRDTVKALGVASEKRDPYTAGHQSRVSLLATEIAKRMGVDRAIAEGIRMASLLHDIGKIGVPSEILTKPGRLTDAEFTIVKDHSRLGHEIIKDIDFPWPVADIVIDHHELLDGSGYPSGKKGKQIAMETRIVTIADIVDAMTSHRPYHPARTKEIVVNELKRRRKTQFDKGAVDACLGLLNGGFEFPVRVEAWMYK